MTATTDPTVVPRGIKQRLDRGRAEMRLDLSKRMLCQRFEDGDSYHYVNEKGILSSLPTALISSTGRGKPPHRQRNSYNHIRPLIQDKISSATSRIPSFEVDPSTSDPEAWGAAQMATQVLLYGYDQWDLRDASVMTVANALITGEGFAMPYFSENVGPYDDQGVGDGDIKVKLFNGNEVYWEAGVRFQDSLWWATEQAEAIELVQAYPGYDGSLSLRPDADASDIPSDRKTSSNLVMVTNYYERPSPSLPRGQRLIIANQRIICPPEDYPLIDDQGNVLDEPILHRLSYNPDIRSPRTLGLVWQLIDCQRTIQDCVNKCVSGDTLVSTKDGLRSAAELSGQTVATLAGDGVFRDAKWKSYGTDQLWRVTLDDGTSIHATQNHRWIIRRGGKSEWVTTPMLEGLSIPFSSLAPHTEVADRDAWFVGVQNGLMWGDGTVEHHRRKNREYVYGSIVQHASEDNIALIERFFPGQHTERRTYANRLWIQARGIDPAMKQLPTTDMGIDYLRGFLAGAIGSDGTVNERGLVSISQKSREVLEAVATIAATVGISHRPIKRHVGANGEWHSLPLNAHSFADASGPDCNLIIKPYHQDRLTAHWEQKSWNRATCRKVVSVEPTDRVEEVYCCEEPVTKTWVLGNGLVTGNCLEWKNRTLNPQMVAAQGSMVGRPDDVPGAIRYYKQGYDQPKWETPPQIPQALFQTYELMLSAMKYIASYEDVQVAPNVAASTAQFAANQAQARWAQFLGDLAEWWSRLGRHSLLLVQSYYDQPRLLQLRGRFGAYTLNDFTGAQLLGQARVRVSPSSLVARTHAETQDRLNWIATTFPGWMPPEVALQALDGGSAQSLVEGFELDLGKINRILSRIRDGTILDSGFRTDMTPDPMGGPPIPTQVPDWMPLPDVDNLTVWKKVIGDWMKTEDYEALEPGLQEVAKSLMAGVMDLQAREQAQQVAAQQAQAAQLGMASAAKPPEAKQTPSAPKSSTNNP